MLWRDLSGVDNGSERARFSLGGDRAGLRVPTSRPPFLFTSLATQQSLGVSVCAVKIRATYVCTCCIAGAVSICLFTALSMSSWISSLPLSEPLTVNKLKDAHRRLMLANHPDRGGSPFIAGKVNEAKALLE